MNRILAATGLVVALTAAAGCSGGPGSGQAAATPTAHSSSPSAALYHQAAQCIRDHGVPGFPDPTQNPQTGHWDLPQGTRKPPDSVMNACRSILDKIPETNDDESRQPLTAAELAKAKQHAACMRQHGLPDWPDPDATGLVHLPQRYAALGKRGIISQLRACRKYDVQNLHMTITNGNGHG